MLVQFPSASTSLSLCCGTEIPPDGRVADGLSIRIRLDEILWQRKREEIERDALIIAVDELARWRMKLLSGWKGIAGSLLRQKVASHPSLLF